MTGALHAQLAAPPQWRTLGPGNTSGRIVDLAVDPIDHDVWYVASASGGLWKTTNGGTTFAPVFDHADTVSLGAVAVAPSQPQTVWVGTGEANARNSVSWGDGCYVSRDGGATFTHVGLEATAQIGRIAIHPTNPELVLVAACGRLWGPNPERGVYRTADGGKSWVQALKVDAETGAVDVVFDPGDPNRVYAATWTRRRNAFDVNDPEVRFGKGAGIWRSTDAGATWTRLIHGLPNCAMGRIGLAVSPAKPGAVWALVSSERIGQKDKDDDKRTLGSFLGGQQPNVQDQQGDDGYETGGVFRSDDGGDSWHRVNSLNPRPYYFGQIRVDPQDVERLYVLGPNWYVSTDGGKKFDEVGGARLHPDYHALWIDPKDPKVLLIGNDGGIARSTDRGATWRFFSNLPVAQYYRVAVDEAEPYRIYGGLQDNGSWVVPSRTRWSDGTRIGDVFNIGWGDGFTALPHPTVPDLMFYSSQFGAVGWRNLRTGDGGGVSKPEPEKDQPLRFEWDTPYVIAEKEPDVIWLGAQRLIRAFERGAKSEFASPDLTSGPPAGITAIALTPKTKGVIWVGTADGRLWSTRNAGKAWKDMAEGQRELPEKLRVSDVELSSADAQVAWVAYDGHRSDDLGVHLFKTTNGGRTFKSIGAGIERGPVLSLQQGAHNPDLLFAGTEFGAYASLDGGDSFFPLRGNLPTVAVRDFAIQARERELVIGTHGRGLWTLDIGGLEGFTKKLRGKSLALCEMRRAVLWVVNPHRLDYGNDSFQIANPPIEAPIHYVVGSQLGGAPTLEILEKGGAVIRKIDAGGEPGLHRVAWDLNRQNDKGEAAGRVGPGTYTVRLRSDAVTVDAELQVVADPLAH